MPDPAPPRKARISRKARAGTACGSGCCPGCRPGCGSGGPRRVWVGRLKIGARGKPACRAPDSEPDSRPRRAGDAGDAGDAGGAGGAGQPWIPDGDSLRQQSRPDAFPLQRAAGEGSETGGRKAPPLRRPQSGVGPSDPAKDPARCVVDPRPAPRHNDNLQPLRRNKFFRISLREIFEELRRPPVGAKKLINAPESAAKTEGRCQKMTLKKPITAYFES